MPRRSAEQNFTRDSRRDPLDFCLAALEEVRRTGKPLRITRFGKPVADVVPAQPDRLKKRQLGMMAGTAEILGDIVGPILDESEWDVLKS